MGQGSLLALAQAFATDPASSDSQIRAAELQAAFAKAAAPPPAAAGGKENSSGAKDVRDAALHCFKAVQQRLAQPGGGDAAQLVAVGRASLAAAAALTPPTPASTAQLQGWRYNFARRLVSCKAFVDAQEEAWALFQQLNCAQPAAPTSGGGAAAVKAASLMVGTVLTLVLCCVEGKLLGNAEAVSGMLQAAESLPPWLSLLKPAEAGKHGDAVYKYLYKAAVLLLERQAWQQLAGACAALLAAAGGDAAAQQRAVQAVGKLSGHMPEEQAAAALAAVAARACSPDLGSSAALDLLSLLCSATQRATGAVTSQQLRQATLSCSSGSQPLLQTAALLLPALALQLPASGDWIAPVSAAVASLNSSIQQLEQQLTASAKPLPLAGLQLQLAVLEAAFQPANTLRRQLAARLATPDKAACGAADPSQLLGGAAAAGLAASVLELLAGMVGVGGRHSIGSTLSSQGHAAAVGLVTAARLRAAASDAYQLCSSQAVDWLLGWDFQRYCSGSTELPPATCAVEPQELSWLASALFNVGVDLHGSQQYVAAVPALQAALAAVALGLRALAEADSPAQEAAPRLADFCRKAAALADAQQRTGDAGGALSSLGHSVALLLQLGFVEPASWQPLGQAFVRQQCDLPLDAIEQPAAAAAQPSKRGRGAATKKVAAAAAAAASPSAPPAAAGPGMLVDLLQQREAELPDGSIAAALEQELQCWAAAGSSAAPHLTRAVQHLLQDIYPAGQRPVEHAGALLALHRLGLPAEDGPGQGGQQLLERAAAVLSKAPGVEAAGMLARARCLLAVDGARQLARQALLEQQNERQRSHAAASTSAVGSREQDAAAVAQLAASSEGDVAAWQRVQQQAGQALGALRAAGSSVAGSAEVLAAFEELAWLLGLQGSEEAAQQLRGLLPDGAEGSDGDVLQACLFPTATATPAAELQQQAEAAAAEGGRSGSVAQQRAALHRQAAEAFAAAGEVVPALYHAAEGHRLLAVQFHIDDAPASAGAQPSSSSSSGSSSGAQPVGWWRLAGAYLGSLLQLGQLFESAGLADEALHALREGQRLAVAAGCHPMAALFAARLADVFCKQGQLAAAEQAASAAEQRLSAVAAGSSLPLGYCQAAVQLVRAHVSVAAGSSIGCGGVSKAAWHECQVAVASCQELATAGGAQHAWCIALQAAALLRAADAALQREDRAVALQHAAAALAATDGGATGSALRHQRAAALLFLGQHAAPPPATPEQHLAVWGLGQTSNAAGPAEASAIKVRAPRKQPAGRSRVKAAAAASEDVETAGAGLAEHQQQLWQALELSSGLLSMHRTAAGLLAEACGRQGFLHLAACLLHCSLGAAMRLQYQLVLFSRQQQLAQRQRRAAAAAYSGAGCGEAVQVQQLEQLLAGLQPGLEWRLVRQLAGCVPQEQEPAAAMAPAARGRKASASKAAAVAAAPDPMAALAALEQQAAEQLAAWQAALPAGTAACSISVLPGSSGGSLLISRLAPPGASGADGGAVPPPLLVSVPVQQLSASLLQHPIRALLMDDDGDAGGGAAVSSLQSVLDEMAGVLEDSGRSMRELSTDTKEQQREWWRARVSLDDRLAALVGHLGTSWLGPWRCLLLGDPLSEPQASQAGQAAAQRLLELLEAAGQPASDQQVAMVRHAAALLAQQGSSMPERELRQASEQLCQAAGLACSQGEQHQLAALLAVATAVPGGSAGGAGAAAVVEMPDAAAPGKASMPARAGKSVKFADDLSTQPAEDQQQQQEEERAAAGAKAGKGRKPAAAWGRKAAATAAAADVEAPAATAGGGDPSPIATLAAAGSRSMMAEEPPQTAVQGGGLCQVFDSLSLAEEEEEAAPSTAVKAPRTGAAAAAASVAAAGTATARSGKHRSRLRMMQAGTPGPATARKPLARTGAAAAAAATAPRAARELPLTVAKTAPPPAVRPGSSSSSKAAAGGAAAGPVLLVLDGGLQALPWESAPGLLQQRLYRMPSLACAAASAQRSDTSVDLASTFYALNPSGDLAATQATFQDWFRSMRGWEGKAGSAPSAAELAAALQSHQFFLYCGHGGGEQYISAAKLRSLERCSAALLMGCSSGRLRAQQHYEPVGAVLAYLLAGCPAAVANLWDVTDKDIDRFSQAVLTSWISGSSGSSSSSSEAAAVGGAGGADMSAAVAAARAACKLPHLVGAAPVCYGLPASMAFA